jgi:flavin reductase (DIM6/NTAB) family NADH-FMN oxidoreductase RutF
MSSRPGAECRTWAGYDGGEHGMLVGEVLAAHVPADTDGHQGLRSGCSSPTGRGCGRRSASTPV